MRPSSYTLCSALAAGVAAAPAAVSHAQLNGMTVFGYQGWYPTYQPDGTAQRNSNFKWFDPPNVTPTPPTYPNRVLTDTLPYVADYPQECWENTNFILADGSHAQFFNSYCTGLIETHFQYMQKYQIDGIFVQRFFDAATPSNDYYNATLFVLQTVRQMAEKYNKYFAVEYDLSGKPSDWDPNYYIPILENDYNNVVKPLFSSPSYIYQDNRPVIEIWGVGINPNGTKGSAFQDIVQKFQAAPENPWIILGIPHNWLDYKTPANDPTGYWGAYQVAQCLQPWPVGAFSSIPDLMWSLQHELLPGKQQTDAWGIKFSGAFTPGGSNRNAARNATYIPPLGNRYNGTFYEEQLKLFTNNTIKPFFNFGAMFDEYTEGTQILPMIQNKNLPTNPNPGFLGSDDDKSVFYYMQLSGQYTTTFHNLWNQAPLSPPISSSSAASSSTTSTTSSSTTSSSTTSSTATSVPTCGAAQSCDINGCAGSFDSNGKATCKGGSSKGCSCQPTTNTCGNPQSCDLNGCAGTFDSNGKATCKGNFVPCQCKPTSNTCGKPQSCSLNGCAGTKDSNGQATCKGNFAGCTCNL